MNFLDTIVAEKRRELTVAQKAIPLELVVSQARSQEIPRPFKRALENVPFALIAEIKKASPSKGILDENFDHCELAREFQAGGAQALSVLTDKKHFGGDPSFIREVKEIVDLPVLRKDFVLDEYQVFESRSLGADAILLIVKALTKEELRRLYDCALSLGMAVLVETHTESEIKIANSLEAQIIGINNRDLSSFAVSIDTSLNLRHFIRPEAIAVSESGIGSAADVLALRNSGFRAALIGEGLVKRSNRAAVIRELIPR